MHRRQNVPWYWPVDIRLLLFDDNFGRKKINHYQPKGCVWNCFKTRFQPKGVVWNEWKVMR